MIQHTIAFVIAYLLAPIVSYAQQATDPIKTPLSYSLAEYGVVLVIALLGGVANWYIKTKGSAAGYSLAALVGELCVSAFSGLIAFWLCEAIGLAPLLTAAAVGMAGHAGARGLDWLERIIKRHAEDRIGGPRN